MADASALVAILLDEADGRALAERLEASAVRVTHPVSVYETATALARLTGRSVAEADRAVGRFLSRAGIAVVSLGEPETSAALDAFARYGRGRGHPARLNMGDCFSYACARVRGMALLYKGEDFALTDLA